ASAGRQHRGRRAHHAASRLERDPGVFLGLSWYYIRLILLTGIGWAMDSMEAFVLIYCGDLISDDISQSEHQNSFLSGAVFVGSFFGNFIFGWGAARYDRRPMFILTLLTLVLGMGLCGLSWNITSLAAFRIITGFGLGGELSIASTLVQELAPEKARERVIVLLESFWAIGCMVAVLMVYTIAPSIGCRGTLYLCCIALVYSAVIRFSIPESPKWLASVSEAVATAKSHLPRLITTHKDENGEVGYNLEGSWEPMLAIMSFQLPGYLFASWLVEVWGRKQALVIFLMGSFAAAVVLGYVLPRKTEVLTIYAYTPENYPTAIQGVGASYPSEFSRIGALIGPYLCAEMSDSWGMSLQAIMCVFGGILVAISIVVFLFGYKPKGKNVELYEDKLQSFKM
uniref:Major facilitator superfamily (MFS) profile domain-containing protein n=1 Tax=Globisporangium ultimum (strain ATCC 200006 / CBS 805.95 / DAOM BR144) TaxID=431595 RepID=K3X3P8_GLOUD